MNNKISTEKRECLICDKVTTSNFRVDAFNYVCSDECFKKATNEEDATLNKGDIKKMVNELHLSLKTYDLLDNKYPKYFIDNFKDEYEEDLRDQFITLWRDVKGKKAIENLSCKSDGAVKDLIKDLKEFWKERMQ